MLSSWCTLVPCCDCYWWFPVFGKTCDDTLYTVAPFRSVYPWIHTGQSQTVLLKDPVVLFLEYSSSRMNIGCGSPIRIVCYCSPVPGICIYYCNSKTTLVCHNSLCPANWSTPRMYGKGMGQQFVDCTMRQLEFMCFIVRVAMQESPMST